MHIEAFHCTERVVHTFITSKLGTNNALLYGLDDIQLKTLEKVQNCAARLVTGARKYDSITPVLRQLHWLPIKATIVFKICVLVHKCLHNQDPHYLKDFIIPINHPMISRSKDHGNLMVPKSRTGLGDHAFAVCAPRVWNRLPASIQTAPSIDLFVKRLKTHLFKHFNVTALWF